MTATPPPTAPDTVGEAPFLPDVLALEAETASVEVDLVTVAIGASAGGVEALQRLFAAMPADSGCAFVVLLHLAPDQPSQLVSVLSRSTTMTVSEAATGVALEQNHVYVLPPGAALGLRGGQLELQTLKPGSRPQVIDRFLTALAADQRERTIAVVLSGTDGDGALGVKAIKSEGGLVLAQLPESAAFRGMPDSAVATGLVDRQLTIEDMPAVIVDYVADAGLRDREAQRAIDGLPAVLDLLHRHAGRDFRGYKTPMLERRVRRRMALSRRPEIGAYIELLRTSAAERAALAEDFLISVTEFFREPAAWRVLAHEVLPELLTRKAPGEAVRVWVPGCATGEEAYSIAILLLESPERIERQLRLQVFATDIDVAALEVARRGSYPRAIESSVGSERLARFFSKNGEMVRVGKPLRDAVTFAPHNLISDPPFSRMDIISCRNLLIYLQPDLQRRALQSLHYALVSDGVLALGKSETVAPLKGSFRTVSHGARIFRRDGPAPWPVMVQRRAQPGSAAERPSPQAPAAVVAQYGALVQAALLQRKTTSAVLTDREGRALYFYGLVRRYVEQPQGATTTDLFAMLDGALRPQVRAAMHRALTEHSVVETVAALPMDSGERAVRISVIPLADGPSEDLLLLTFDDVERTAPAGPLLNTDDQALRMLEDELRSTQRDLRGAIEELEAANEELKVANEEAMSNNEELQSTNEELETSQEELQSVNEELTTVNQERSTPTAERAVARLRAGAATPLDG